jgi:hypothetical protein
MIDYVDMNILVILIISISAHHWQHWKNGHALRLSWTSENNASAFLA